MLSISKGFFFNQTDFSVLRIQAISKTCGAKIIKFCSIINELQIKLSFIKFLIDANSKYRKISLELHD